MCCCSFLYSGASYYTIPELVSCVMSNKGDNKNTSNNKDGKRNGRKRKKGVVSSDSEMDENDFESAVELSDGQVKLMSLFEQKMAQVVSDFETKLATRDSEIDILKAELVNLKKKFLSLDDKQEDADAYERRDTLIISGSGVPVATDSEDSAKVVSDLVKDKVGYFLRPAEISAAHRLGKKPVNQAPDKRNLIVKLCRRDVKRDLMIACKTTKPPNLFVNESLTRTRSTVLFGLRQARKKHPNIIDGCGSSDGKVFVWIKPPKPDAPLAKNTKIMVNTKERFVNLCEKTLKCNSSVFVNDWPSC